MQTTARETIRAITVPLLLIAVGGLFLADYSGGLSARQTWPVILILLGLSLAVQSIAGDDGRVAVSAQPAQPKRKSLFLPILLIGVGAFLLARSFWPEIPLRAWVANYWPWILIFWGGVRLLEVVLARLLGWTPSRRLGGGAVFAALFLVLAGSIVRANHQRGGFNFGRVPPFEFLQDTYEFPVENAWDTAGESTVLLKNLRGRIQVTGTNRDGLRVQGEKRIRASDRREAEELDSESQLGISRSDEETSIGIASIGSEALRISFDVSLETPRNVALQAEGRIEELAIEDISNSVSVSSGSRIIRLSRIGGPVTIRTGRGRKVKAEDLGATFELDGKVATVELTRVTGAVDVDGELFGTIRLAELQAEARIRSKNGELRFTALPGEVEVKVRSVSGSQLKGPVRVNSDHWRRVTLERLTGDVKIRGQRMDVELSADESFGDIEVVLERGDIELRLPDEAKFTLEAVTERGHISHQLSAESLQAEKRGRGSSIQGSTGEGPRITLRTKRGNIVLRGVSGSVIARVLWVESGEFESAGAVVTHAFASSSE